MERQDMGAIRRIIEALDHCGVAMALMEPDASVIYCNRAWKVFHGIDPAAEPAVMDSGTIARKALVPGIEEFKERVRPGERFTSRIHIEEEGREAIYDVFVDYLAVVDPPVVLVQIRDVGDVEAERIELRSLRERLADLVDRRTEELEDTNRRLRLEMRDREQAGTALRESEERFRTLFRAVVVPTYAWRCRDGELYLEEYNEAAREMTKGMVDTIVGISASKMYASRPDILEDMRRCCGSGETIQRRMEYTNLRGELWHLDVKYVKAGGDLVIVHVEDITSRIAAERELELHRAGLERLVAVRTAELESANERLRREADERQKARQALAESEEKYRIVSEMTSDYTFVSTVHEGGRLEREWVAGAFERITGYTQPELDARLATLEVIHPEDRAIIRRMLAAEPRDGEVEAELRMLRKDGGTAWVRVQGRPLAPSPQGLQRILVAIKDISERKAAELELSRRNRELAVVNRIREIFDGSADRGALLVEVLDTVFETGEATAAGLCAVEADRGVLVLKESRGISRELVEGYREVPLDEPAIAEILSRRGVTVAEEDLPESDARHAPAKREMGIYRTVALPVIVAGEPVAIYLFGFSADMPVTAERRRFFEIVHGQLGLRLERLELLAERARSERQMKELANRLIESLEQERNMIALKLHDELGQEIVALNAEFLFLETRLDSCDNDARETLEKIRQQLRELSQSARQLSYSLHPSMLEDLGLVPTLHWYIDKYVRSAGVAVELVTAGIDERLTGEAALTLYRVAQEALTNVVKHSGARAVTVRLVRGYPDVIMQIEDDGKGFAPGGDGTGGRGLGIVGMRERIERMGGRFRISSHPGRGTKIRATVPMEVQDGEPDQDTAR
ncbi:MAG: PAS domain S-box protein [Candidatus Krumholzibacteria bacterium]|nr:PAS domain S-box protein [Candidatus Krumholzibacteria bacterium]